MKVNTTLINARQKDVQSIVGNGIYLEKLSVDGKTPEEVINEAKRVLNLSENDSIQAEFKERVEELNKKTNLFVKLNSSINELVSLDKSVENLQTIRDELAQELAKAYSVEVEDLYLEEL